MTIHSGYYLIDTGAWIGQRTGERSDTHTSALAEFVRCEVFDDYHPNMDNSARMQLWCAARKWAVLAGNPIWHHQPVLTRPVQIVLATDPDGNAWALVSIDDEEPAVYCDLTTDDGYWQQVSVVDIVCPAGHRWTWLDERILLDASGVETTTADLFGRDMPFTPCRGCQAFAGGASDKTCECDGPTAIYCPSCDRRCTLQLPDIPLYGHTRNVDGRR